MRLERFLSMIVGGKKEGQPLEGAGSKAIEQPSVLSPAMIVECERIIREDASHGYAAGIEMPHGVNYLAELPSDVRQSIERIARSHYTEGETIEEHSERWTQAVDAAFDELLLAWRTWLPEAWSKKPREERRKSPRQ